MSARLDVGRAREEIARTGVTITVTGPQASGKSTLRRRFERLLAQEGVEVVQLHHNEDVLHMKLTPEQMGALRAGGTEVVAPAEPEIGWNVVDIEWDETGETDLVADTLVGQYCVALVHSAYRLFIYYPSNGNLYQTVLGEGLGLEDAKSMAQRDFSERVLEALQPIVRVRHLKTGGVYEVLSTEGKVQSRRPLNDMDVLITYRGADGQIWHRPPDEMHDGRFIYCGAVGKII